MNVRLPPVSVGLDKSDKSSATNWYDQNNLCDFVPVHKDPYENVYCVVSGHKDFILIPPVSYHNVTRRTFPSAVFKTNDSTGEMDIQPILNGEFNKSKAPLIRFN